MEYYDFCATENLGIYWCELNNPGELDIRRHSSQLRQLAIEEIDRVINKYNSHNGLATDVLKSYRNTLEDNSYLQHNTKFSPVDTLAWHVTTETILNKTTKFVDLWPALAKEMQYDT
jgi:hypothetical protein